MNCILALETSSPVLSVALKKKGEPPAESALRGFMKHAENLLPMIDRLLRRKKIRIQDIDTFLIGRGPGSFTGLRVGFAALKGFLAARKRPCLGAGSLDLIAERVPPAEGKFLGVLLDARREKIYARIYRRGKNEWRAETKPQTLAAQDLIELFPSEIHLAGDALLRYREFFEKEKSKRIHFLPEKFWYPRASTLIDYPRLQKLERPADFVPFYFRLSEAEERKKEYAPAR